MFWDEGLMKSTIFLLESWRDFGLRGKTKVFLGHMLNPAYYSVPEAAVFIFIFIFQLLLYMSLTS